MKLNIGENIRKLRNEKRITQEQLAEHLSITYQSVSKWENNVTTPDLYLVPLIAEFFEVPIDELFKINMRGYKNKAERFLSIYEHNRTNENYFKADEEYEKLFNGVDVDTQDMFNYGYLNEMRSYELIKKAESFYSQAMDAGYEKAEYQLNHLLAVTNRQYENIEKYEKAMCENRENARIWYLLALSYSYSKATLIKALEVATEGLRKYPDDSFLLNINASVCRALARYEDAVNFCTRAISSNPEMIDNYYLLAFILTDMKNYPEAIKAWEQVISVYEKLELNAEEIEMGTKWPKESIQKLQAMINK